MKKRENIEKQVLRKFIEVAKECGLNPITGQSSENLIGPRGLPLFQFGDLRVETETHFVVIEAESAGGVTNLAKYWFCVKKECISRRKPVILLHLFRQTSKNDYASHLELWNFLWQRMRNDVNDCLKAKLYPYKNGTELEHAVKDFKNCLNRKWKDINFDKS